MSGSGDLIDFNIIEGHKENIQALPSGRSAKALAQLYSPPLLGANPSPSLIQDANSKERQVFEKELTLIDEADDPLDVYDRYVKWTLDAYPSAQATPQSGLLPLLERATKTFQSSSHYKNDPRYLKIWLHYIRLFSDAPREVFAFLARHSIGEGLALYYEEFAAWLENAGRWSQAEEVYRMGIEKDARPVERLARKFGEFERRKAALPEDTEEPKSPALPVVRAALAAKTDPFAAASPAPQQQPKPTAAKKAKSSKMQIFADVDEADRPSTGSSSQGWDNIGTLAERKKENIHAAKPMAGETLKVGKTNGGMQKMMVFKDTVSLTSLLVAFSAPHVYKNRTKLSPCMQSSKKAFLPKHLAKSTSGSIDNYQCVRNPKTGRLECVFVNLEAVYPRSGGSSEYSFEELRARHRGWMDKEWPRESRGTTRDLQATESLDMTLDPEVEPEEAIEPPSKGFKIHLDEPEIEAEPAPKPKQRGFAIFEDESLEAGPSENPPKTNKVLTKTSSKTLALNDENDENAPPAHPTEAEIRKKVRREERANRTRKIQVMDVKHIKNETKTVQLNLDSPTGQKPKRKKNIDKVQAEPTMTINTKEAMDEIYGIFNAPLPSQAEQSENSESENSDSDDDDDEEDDYTTGDESTATGKLSAAPSDYGDETRNELLTQAPTEEPEDEHTGWSDFTTTKHVPREDEADTDNPDPGQDSEWDLYRDENQQPGLPGDEEMTTPDEENVRTHSVPIASEDYEPPSAHFRQMTILPNHRLPFMTPIAEQTESSLGTITARAQKDYFNAKTPSRQASSAMPEPEDDDDETPSSPFQEVTVDLNDDKFRVLQPIRTKSTKGNISLGKGTATSQIEAKTVVQAAPEAVQKGPIVLEQQCNPMDPYLRETILSQIKPSLASFKGYHDHSDTTSGRTAEIKKFIRSQSKANKNSTSQEKTGQTLSLPPILQFEESEATYTIKRELGAGTFAPVYLVENSEASQAQEAMDDENAPATLSVGKLAHRKPLEAIKMEEPLSAWEFFILQQSHRRLGVSRATKSMVRAHEMHMFRDECFLIEEYRNQGTLLDLVNLARADSASTTGGGMDEVMTMWLTVEIFRTVEALHSKQMIHGDLKGDNVLVRFDDPGMETDWSPTYFSSGAHGWASKGICLIDFGRGIDMKQFVPNVAFIADWKTSEADCAEMRELRPWTYQVDYHGMAGIVHSMLFGKYMETIADRGAALGQGATKTYRIRENLKRYWQVEIWQEVFNLLLNPLAHLAGEEGKRMPVLNGMRGLRMKMEGWVEENCERGMGLKGMIARMEAMTREKMRRSGRT
jgi:checkpoint serine/threonine-protein kinase